MRGPEPRKTSVARRLRRQSSNAETVLWQAIRNRQIAGAKFVRQEPVGPYFADFLCRKRMLVIETDGETHSTSAELAHDARRTAYLQALGYRVIRFSNIDVYEALDGVLDSIAGVLKE